MTNSLAEIGRDMSRFPTAGHLVSWAKLSPRTILSGARTRGGRTGKGNPYLKGILGEAAAAAAKTDTFLGERNGAWTSASASSRPWSPSPGLPVIIWSLLADPQARDHDLGAGYYASRTTPAARPATTSASSKPSGSP